ncbi:MAG: HAD-IC family P-type ATPase [Thermoleophilia bacterium]|nr:HAD-IC family P-type ATPase [Thermoleophilia bacterium]
MGNGHRSPEQGLTAAEAAQRLKRLGPPPETSSRSTSSIVAGNVFTLFNAIIAVFFVLDLGLGLWADALFGVIAVINSYIGIRQELKAKATLDELAVLVAPRARVVRDGAVVELAGEEVVPGDVVQIGPGDQLIADGEAIASRGLTLDESMLTGEADGIQKARGERVLSGSFCVSGSGHYVVDAVRDESYAGRLAGEARAFRHPPSPLQEEVNQVIIACTYLMLPLAAVLIASLSIRSVDLHEAAQTATAGLVTLIPEGLVLLMSVTFAVAAVRLARRDTLVQQMSASESLAAVDTICVDKTGTLTAGELRLAAVEFAVGVDPAVGAAALGRFAASAGERNRTLETIAERYPAQAAAVSAEIPFSSEWKWSGMVLADGRASAYVLGAPDILAEAGALTLPPDLAAKLDEETSAGRRVVAFGEADGQLPADAASSPPPRLTALALIVLEETLRPDAAETIAFMREQEVDLKLISGDARATVTAVAYGVGVPREAGVVEGPDLPEDPDEGRPIYGVLLDMVGDREPRFLQEGTSVTYAPIVVRKVWQAARRAGHGGYFPETVGGPVGDDHVPLLAAGLPTVDIIDLSYGPGNSWWHTPEDTADKVSAATLRMVAEVMAELLYSGG